MHSTLKLEVKQFGVIVRVFIDAIIMSLKLGCFTSNVRGLGDNNKRCEVFYHLHLKAHDIMFLQETHSTKGSLKRWSMEWGNKIWAAKGSSNAQGVAILFKKSLKVVVHNVILDDNGRYLIMYITMRDKKWLLVNVYVPNDDKPEFFADLFKQADSFAPDYTIVGGDLNLGLEALIDRKGKSLNNDKAAVWLKEYLKENEYIDTWQYYHEDQHGFTWRRMKPSPVFSRLDYLFVSQSLLQYIDSVDILPSYKSDHSRLEINLNFNLEVKGKGYWKFNLSLLRDPDYLERINDLIEIELSTNQHLKPKDRWEVLKVVIRGSTIQFAARKKKSNKLKVELLEKS